MLADGAVETIVKGMGDHVGRVGNRHPGLLALGGDLSPVRLLNDAANAIGFEIPASVRAEGDFDEDERYALFAVHDGFVRRGDKTVAGEVLETIAEYLPQWQADTDNKDALIEVRRAFHTLKGSGRMVRALIIGELGWSIENLLNRVLDRSIEPNAPVQQVVLDVVALMPALVDEFAAKAQRQRDDVDLLAATAHALAKGLTPPKSDAPATQQVAEPAGVDDATEVVEQVESVTDQPLDGESLDGEPLDPQLLEIFRNEAETHLDTLVGFLADCAQELPGLFATLAMIHDRGLSLDWQAPPGLVLPRDREDLLELLGNLLDNACKWADSQVRLQLERAAAGYLIRIEDDGPGIDAEQREEVLDRGSRLDEQVAGHGLGLGIVRDIVDAWGGQLQLGESALGGLAVSIELPARSP